MAYHRYHHVDTRIVRIFNTYGPRMRLDDGRVSAQLHRPGPARRAAHRLRRRLADAQLLLRRRPGRGHRAPAVLPSFHEPVNIGNPTEMTILEFAKEIIELTGTKSKIVFQPLPQDDPRVRRPDITRARSSWAGSRSQPALMACAERSSTSSPRFMGRSGLDTFRCQDWRKQ